MLIRTRNWFMPILLQLYLAIIKQYRCCLVMQNIIIPILIRLYRYFWQDFIFDLDTKLKFLWLYKIINLLNYSMLCLPLFKECL